MLAPVWKELAELLFMEDEHNDNLVIAQMDINANDVKGLLTIDRVPTLILYPKDNKEGITYYLPKSATVDYNYYKGSKYTVEGLYSWLKENSSALSEAQM